MERTSESARIAGWVDSVRRDQTGVTAQRRAVASLFRLLGKSRCLPQGANQGLTILECLRCGFSPIQEYSLRISCHDEDVGG